MKTRTILLSAIGLCLSFLGCKDDIPYAEVGTTEVDILITNPVENPLITSGNELTHLDGKIDANAKLGGWQVQLIKKETGEVVETYSDLYEHTQFIVHHHWFFDLPDTTEFTVTVQALTIGMNVIAEKSLDIIYLP